LSTSVALPAKRAPRSQTLAPIQTVYAAAPLAIIAGVAFAIRMVIVLLAFRGVASPANGHAEFGYEMGWVARSLALSHGFSSPFVPFTGATALVPPLYPYLMASVFRLFGIYSQVSAFVLLSLNSALSALTCVPVFLLARQLGEGRTGRRAAWLWALYPFAIFFSATYVWDFSLTALLFACCWYLAQNLHRNPAGLKSAGFGLLYGLTTLSNPSVLSLFPLAVGFALWKIRRTGGAWFRHGCLIVLGAALMVVPWTVRNHRVLGADVPLRDGFWLECWAGNHGDLSNSNPAAAHPASNPAEMKRYQAVGEVDYLAEKRVLAIQYMQARPVATITVSARRIVRFWTGFWSFRSSYLSGEPLDVPNVFFCSGITVLMVLGAQRCWRRNRKAALPYLLLLLIFPLPYYATHTSMDYRQPIEPEIIVLVAIALGGPDASWFMSRMARLLPFKRETEVFVDETV